MPGIAGVAAWTPGDSSIDKLVRQMVTMLNHTSPSVEEIRVTDQAALGAVRLTVYPFRDLVAEDEHTMLSFWGYLWDQDDLKRRSGDVFPNIRDSSIGKVLLAIFNNEGIDGLCNINGRFVIAIWDKTCSVLRLMVDRCGFCKLFYWVTPKRVLFASEYKAIIWHKDFHKTIDQHGLADFMALGYSTGDRTFFENIRLLPPGSVTTFDSIGIQSVHRYWDYTFHGDDDPVWVEDDYIDLFFAKLSKATSNQIRSERNIGLPISAGLDSRTLAGMVDRLDFRGGVEAFSYGHPYAYDVVWGRRIAHNLRYKHIYIPIESDYLRRNAEEWVWLLEGTVNCVNAHMLSCFPFMKENSVDTIMTGFFGDVLCGSYFRECSKSIRGGTDEDAILRQQYAFHADIMSDNDMAVYFRDRIYESVKGKTFEAFRSKYYSCPSKNMYFRSIYLSSHERQRRYTSFNLHAFDFVAEVLSPFLDHDFVRFIYHVPSELMIFQNLYKKMIIRHLPKVASVPHNETKLPLNASWIRKGLQWRWESLIRNPLIRATIGRHYAQMNDNYQNTHEAIRTGSRDFVEKSIRDNEFLAQFFKMTKLNELLDNHISGKVHEPTKITALLTFALWGNMFVDNQKPTFQILSNR